MHQVSLTYQKKLENKTTFKTDLLSSLEILDFNSNFEENQENEN